MSIPRAPRKASDARTGQQWIAPEEARLPTVMKKAVESAENQTGDGE